MDGLPSRRVEQREPTLGRRGDQVLADSHSNSVGAPFFQCSWEKSVGTVDAGGALSRCARRFGMAGDDRKMEWQITSRGSSRKQAGHAPLRMPTCQARLSTPDSGASRAGHGQCSQGPLHPCAPHLNAHRSPPRTWAVCLPGQPALRRNYTRYPALLHCNPPKQLPLSLTQFIAGAKRDSTFAIMSQDNNGWSVRRPREVRFAHFA